MPELASFDTPDWTLSVWSKDVDKPKVRLERTLEARGKTLPKTEFRFSPDIVLLNQSSTSSIATYEIASPIFFENRHYEIEFFFKSNNLAKPDPVILHRLQQVEEIFHFRKNRLRGTINTGNDIGWFKLELVYIENQIQKRQAISFQVLPIKMDLESDVDKVLSVVDEHYPLWRFSLKQKTEYEMALSRKPHEYSPLLWLAQFERLHLQLEKAVKKIISNPHLRLMGDVKYLKADRIKGRLNPKLEEKIKSDFSAGMFDQRYRKNNRKLSIDTPENRFVKMALLHSRSTLTRFIERVKSNNGAPDQTGLSESFFDKVETWREPIEKMLSRPFFSEIGVFTVLSSESLVLHEKAGYADVYRIWQQLKLYLDVLGNSSSISMKTIAELYEVWCFLEIRRIIKGLGFSEVNSKHAVLKDNVFGKKLVDGIGAAFEFRRKVDGVRIRLAHEPIFSKRGNSNIYSFVTAQKPDLFLEVKFSDGREVRWIFDAKYRIENPSNAQGNAAIDYAPDDAINQMHRYRDALVYMESSSTHGSKQKSRPILGAFVLYPGYFDESTEVNPYKEAIDSIGIGAFPMIPGRPNIWMSDFLGEKLGLKSYPSNGPITDKHFVEESVRISPLGLSLSLYRDLTLAVSTANPRTRTQTYLERMSQGKLKWFHMQQWATERNSVSATVMKELRYCAVAELNEDEELREIKYVYDVLDVRLVRRSEITSEQSGMKTEPANPDVLYWLMQLGRPRELSNHVVKKGIKDHHYLKLVSYADLEQFNEWEQLPELYKFMGRKTAN